MTQHTPGPWIINLNCIATDASKGNILICRIYNSASLSSGEVDSNAHLIAAAPDLLEALELIHDSTAVLNHLPPENLRFICEAIKKAKGENK